MPLMVRQSSRVTNSLSFFSLYQPVRLSLPVSCRLNWLPDLSPCLRRR